MPQTAKTFGNWLRNIRVSAKLTQDTLAELTGIHKVTISRLENDHQKPEKSNVLAIAQAVGLSQASAEVQEGLILAGYATQQDKTPNARWERILYRVPADKVDSFIQSVESLVPLIAA